MSFDDITHELGLSGDSFRQHITDLRIADVGDGNLPAVALQILKNPSRVDALTLEFLAIKFKIGDFEDDENVDDAGRAANARLENAFHRGLLKGLFGSPKQPTLTQCLFLRTLNLHGMCLLHSPSYIFHAIDFRPLKNLQIFGCWGTDVFLSKMSRLPETKRPRLHRLEIYHEEKDGETNWISDDDHTDRTIISIKEVLLSMEDTLDTLWIVLRGIRARGSLLLPIAPGVANHGGTLLYLNLDVRNYTPEPGSQDNKQYVDWFPRDEWEQVCASMEKLEQLYVPFPKVVADSQLSARPEFQDYLTAALQIPTLKMLNMNTWPYPLGITIPKPKKELKVIPNEFYYHCLEFLVRYMVKQRDKLIHSPFRRLDIVGFGLQEDNHYMAGLKFPLDPVYFVLSQGRGLDRETTWIWQASWEEIRKSSLKNRVRRMECIDWIARRIKE
ncbi:MAG: hypothetical protein Q9182_005874 [Xanthomendoza sp. 2 TL-2023]